MEKVIQPDFVLFFEGRDITKDLRPYILQVRYTDNSTELDTLDLILDNTDKIFTTSSFPTTDLHIRLYIKDLNEERYIYCGDFKKEKLRRQLYLVSINATSVVKKKNIKITKKNRTFKNTTLKQIVSQIANENSVIPIIKSNEDVPIQSILQQNQTDSQFIQKLADKYGYYQKITPEKLFFIKQEELESQPVIKTFSEQDLIDLDLEDTTGTLYKKAIIYYHDAKKNKTFKYEYNDPNIDTGETLKINRKVESLEEAKKVAKETLKEKNKFKQSGIITVEGNPKLVAGATIQLDLKDKFSGKYYIEQSTHTIDENGYLTQLQVRKIF